MASGSQTTELMQSNIRLLLALLLTVVFYRCGKLLRSEIDVQAHAAKTGHSSFSESTEEIKPLTAEEKARQLEL